jgi:transposase
MIVPPTGVRVLVATKPVDFRKGMDGLAAYVQEQMQADPFSGVVYVFRAKCSDKVKLLFWDGTGVCLVIKRLEGAKFRWPAIQDGVMRLSPAQLSALLEGLDWSRVHMRRVRAPQATASRTWRPRSPLARPQWRRPTRRYQRRARRIAAIFRPAP